MASLPYIQLYVADYLSDTSHLTTLEHGAYLLLIFNYWQKGESFKAKDERSFNKRLAAVTRLSIEEFESVKESLQEFFEVMSDNDKYEWYHKRIERDLERVSGISKTASKAGIASGEARRRKKEMNDRSTNDERMLNYKDKDKDKNIKESITNVIPKKSEKKEFLKPDDVSDGCWEDFVAHRKKHKAAITSRVIIGIRKEADLAGITLQEALDMAVMRGWMSFQASWVTENSKNFKDQRNDRDDKKLGTMFSNSIFRKKSSECGDGVVDADGVVYEQVFEQHPGEN